MAGSGSSFLAALRKEGKVNGSVLDDLAQLGAGRQTAIARPPVQVPTNDKTVVPETPVAPVAPAMTTPVPESTPVDLAAPQVPTFDLQPLYMSVADKASSDQDFYQKTGRAPSSTDRLLMQSRASFMQTRGREPTSQELLYEAQRGIVQQFDNNEPGAY